MFRRLLQNAVNHLLARADRRIGQNAVKTAPPQIIKQIAVQNLDIFEMVQFGIVPRQPDCRSLMSTMVTVPFFNCLAANRPIAP